MAKKKSTAALEGEEHASSPTEEVTPEVEAAEEAAPAEAVEEAVVEEAAEEIAVETGLELTNIKLLIKGPIRGHDGHPIAEGQTGEVATSVADALVGRGQAEVV